MTTQPTEPEATAEHHHCMMAFQTHPDCEDCRQEAVAYERWSQEMDAARLYSKRRLKIEKDWPKDLKYVLKSTRCIRTIAEGGLRHDEMARKQGWNLNQGTTLSLEAMLATAERNLAALEQPMPPWHWQRLIERYVDPRQTLN